MILSLLDLVVVVWMAVILIRVNLITCLIARHHSTAGLFILLNLFVFKDIFIVDLLLLILLLFCFLTLA